MQTRMALPSLRTITELEELFQDHFPLPDHPCFSPVGIRRIIREVRAGGTLGQALWNAGQDLVAEYPAELQEMIRETFSLAIGADVPIGELSVAMVHTYLVALAEWCRAGTITPESVYAIPDRLDLLISLCAMHKLCGHPHIGLALTDQSLEVTIPHRRR